MQESHWYSNSKLKPLYIATYSLRQPDAVETNDGNPWDQRAK